jgi:hypothetical protein
MLVAPESVTGADHAAPPVVVLTTWPPGTSNASPRPAYSVSGSRGSIASAPMARLGSVSAMGYQRGLISPNSNVFQMPPPAVDV